MMISRRRLSWACFGLAIVPVACASPSPVLYTLDAAPGGVLHGAPRIVILQDIGLAPYLDRKPIVRSSSDYHIDVETNNWWGETFSAMIGRVLVAELDQRLPASQVFQESSVVAPRADATVAVNITRFDRNESGTVVLAVQISVSRALGSRRPVIKSLRFTAQPSSPDVPGQVAAMSVALGQLADSIAGALAE